MSMARKKIDAEKNNEKNDGDKQKDKSVQSNSQLQSRLRKSTWQMTTMSLPITHWNQISN